jgi:predicted enzyme related to lactoylglutathione lyase
MKRVTGLGGVFFKAQDRAGMMEWYRDRLGIDGDPYGHMFRWRDHGEPEEVGYTVWSPFAADTKYFSPSDQPFMVNFRVENLTELVPTLVQEGVQVVGEIEQHENGKFAWILDPEGRKIELWEPVPSREDPYL